MVRALVVAAVVAVYAGVSWAEDAAVSAVSAHVPLVGGACDYAKFAGTCEVISVRQTEETRAQALQPGGAPYEGFEVKFKFLPAKPVAVADAGWPAYAVDGVVNAAHVFTLSNSWFPGARYLEKYRVREGAAFPCELGLLTQGTCTPVAIRLEGVAPDDYFESAPKGPS